MTIPSHAAALDMLELQATSQTHESTSPADLPKNTAGPLPLSNALVRNLLGLGSSSMGHADSKHVQSSFHGLY